MQPITRIEVPARLTAFFTLAGLLERLERSPGRVDPDQYRTLAARLVDEFGRIDDDPAFRPLLACLPAASELYENLHYAHAGLCRSPLKHALEAEMSARALFDRLAAPGTDLRDAGDAD